MMYEPDRSPTTPPDDQHDGAPLEPWMLELARNAVDELDASVEVPRDMMWARIARTRHGEVGGAGHAEPSAHRHGGGATDGARVLTLPTSRWSRWPRQLAGLAAVLVAGVAIGRFSLPSAPAGRPMGVDTSATVAAAEGAGARRDDPAHVAMQEHLARTVSLLTTVGDSGAPKAEANLAPLAKELLSTTRLLLDQPQLRDERTRRLLQDLELVLVQVIQARGSAPETQRAPQETLQETDLLTRVRAIVTASASADQAIYGGD